MSRMTLEHLRAWREDLRQELQQVRKRIEDRRRNARKWGDLKVTHEGLKVRLEHIEELIDMRS